MLACVRTCLQMFAHIQSIVLVDYSIVLVN